MLGAGLAVALLLGAPSLDLELGIRTEARGSRLTPDTGNRAPQHRASAEATPLVGLTLDDRAWRVHAAYVPRLWSPDLEEKRLHVDQQVLLGGEVNPDPSFRLRLLATGVRGTLDPLADPWSDFATSALPAPTPRPQPYESARLVADGAVRFASATTISATGNLVWSGGTTPEARLLLPPQRTVNGTLVLEQGIGARTLVGLHADGTVARTWPAGPDNETGFAYLSLRVDRSLTRSTRVWISGGAAFVRETSTGRDEPIQNGAPGGELGITHTMRRSGLTSTGSVRLAPEIDRLTGAVRRAVSSTVTLAWSPAPRWTLRAEGTGSVTFPEREPRVVAAELRAQRTFENGVQLEWGARMRRQVDPRFVNGSFSEVGAFLAVDWTLARARPPRRPPTPAGAPAQ